MRRFLLAILALAALASASRANQAARGWCEDGGQVVITSGLTSSTQVQQSFPTCTVTVFVHGGGVATIFSDNNATPTPLANPFTAQVNGQWNFYAANGRYDIQLSGAGFPSPVTYSDVSLFDGGAGGIVFGVYGGATPYSASPVFNASAASIFSITMTGDVTTPTVVNPTQTGQVIEIYICQDGAGSHAFTFPPNFTNTTQFTVASIGNSCTPTSWWFNGSTWQPFTGGASVIGIILPSQGGTGVSNPSAHGVALSEGTSNFAFSLPTSNAQCFMSAAANFATTDPSFQTCPSGSGGVSAGSQGTINAAGAVAGTFQATLLVEASGFLTIPEDTHFGGINPWTDARNSNVRVVAATNAIPAINGITATTTSGSPTVTVTTSFCGSQTGNICFKNNDNVVIVNAGATITMGSANTPTVTPFNSRSGTGNADGVAAPAGSTAYNYKVFGVDLNRGTTAPSSVGSTSTGAATLGEITYAVTSASWSNDTITFTGATNPGVSPGTVVIIDTPTGSGDGQWLGDWKVSTVTGAGFTVASVGLDTREGGVKLTSSGGFTAHFFNFNKVTWAATAPAAHFYGVCSDRASPGTYHLLGVSILPTNPSGGGNTIGILEFDDYGASMPTNVIPWELSDANCSGSGTNDDWVATILSGAGTTTLTTTAGAPNSNGGGQPIRFDNTANYITAINSSLLSGKSGVVVLPLDSGGKYVFNAPLNIAGLSTDHIVLSAPQGFVANSTVYVGDRNQLYCDLYPPGTGSDTSFQSKSSPNISFTGPYGLFAVGGGGSADNVFYTSGCQFSGVANANAVVMQDGGGGAIGSIWHDSQFIEGGGLMGKAFVCRGNGAGSCQVNFTGVTNVAAGGQFGVQSGHTLTPGMWCVECGRFNAERLMMTGRAGINLSVTPPGMSAQIGFGHYQGGSIPFVTLAGATEGGNAGVAINLTWMGGMELDTMPNPCVAYLPGAGTLVGGLTLSGGYCNPTSGISQITGTRFDTLNGGSGQNRNNGSLGSNGNAHDAIFGQPFSAVGVPYLINRTAGAFFTMPNYPIGASEQAQPAPTVTVGGGGSGSIPVGTYNVVIVPVWWNGGEGSSSVAASANVSGTQNMTVNWTPTSVPPLGYNIYLNSVAPSSICTSVFNPCVSGTTTSVVIPSIPFAEFVSGSGPTASPTMLYSNSVWTPYVRFSATLTPPNPIAGEGLLSFNQTTSQLVCQTSTGANCFPPQVYPGAGIPLSTGTAWGTSYAAVTGNIVGTGQSNTMTTGVWDFTNVTEFRPKSGFISALPATCTGPSPMDVYIATDAQPGRNWYFCTATNTWTQQVNTGVLGLNTYSGAHTALATESWMNFTANATATIPHALTFNKWVGYCTSTCTTLTLAPDSGNITLNGVTAATVTISTGGGAEIECDGTNCFAYGFGTSSGSGTVSSGTVNGMAYYSAATTVASAAPSTAPNGVPAVWTSTASGGLSQPPVVSLPGIVGRAVSGITAVDTILSTDCNPNRVEYIGSVAVAVTLPTATTLGVPKCVFKLVNTTIPAQTVTITPTTWTINGNATLNLTFGQQLWVYVDPNSATNWVADQTDLFGNVSGAAVPASAKLLGSNSSSQLIAAALSNTHIYVGNGSNLPVDVAASGDVTLANTGAFTVTGVNGASVPASASLVGTNSSRQFVAATGHSVALPLLCADTSGSASVQVCNTTPSFTPAAGDSIIYTTTTSLVGTSLTINVNSLGAKPVAKWQTTTTLASNDVRANTEVLATYDGTNWELATVGNAPSGGGQNPCTTTNNSLQIDLSGAFGCATEFTYASSTITVANPGKIDLSGGSVTAALLLPKAAAAAPTNGGILSYDTTTNDLVWGNATNTSYADYVTAAPTANTPVIFNGTNRLTSSGYTFSAGTVTSGHLACYTSSGTVGNCTGLSGVLGVFVSSTQFLSNGEISVTLDTTQNVTFGDNLCASSSSFGTAHDNGVTACTTGLGIGIVKTTASSVSSATAFVNVR